MLINTVILFIRDTLPIFMLVSLLLCMPHVRGRYLFVIVISGLIGALVVYNSLARLGNVAAGGGFELLKVVLYCLSWIGLCGFIAWRNRLMLALLTIGIVVNNAVHFYIYSIAYWPSQHQDFSLLIGTVIGLGISLSLATLLYLLLSAAHDWLRLTVLSTFMAGQVAGVSVLLEQIDYLPAPLRLWDSSFFVTDGSEYGHLLNVLFGYEATPSLSYLIVYGVALSTPLFIAWRRQHSDVTGRSA